MQTSLDLCMNKTSSRSGMTVRKWIIYIKYVEIGFLPKNNNKSYSRDFKERIVQEYLDGMGFI